MKAGSKKQGGVRNTRRGPVDFTAQHTPDHMILKVIMCSDFGRCHDMIVVFTKSAISATMKIRPSCVRVRDQRQKHTGVNARGEQQQSSQARVRQAEGARSPNAEQRRHRNGN
jgi:hypothetical protein